MNRGTRIRVQSSQQDVRSRGRQDYAVTSKRCCLVTVANLLNTGAGESKAVSNRHSSDMVSVLHGVQEAKCSGTASNSTLNSEQKQFEFTHPTPTRSAPAARVPRSTCAARRGPPAAIATGRQGPCRTRRAISSTSSDQRSHRAWSGRGPPP
jgi:hypothetical protein